MGSKRVIKSNQDQSSIDSTIYSPYSGAQKNFDAGPYLVPIPTSSTTWTTDASTVKALPKQGCNLAIYNNASTVATVTLGTDATVTSQAVGAVDSNGNPGIPLPPNSWTSVACWNKQYVITSAATAKVFIIMDDTMVTTTSNTSLP